MANNNPNDEFEDFDVTSDDSMDDVADDSEDSFVEDDLSDESWDDQDSEGESEKPRKKKGGMFNLLLIGAGVLLFVGFIYMKMANAPKPAPAVGPEQVAAATPSSPVEANAAQPPAAAELTNPVNSPAPAGVPETAPVGGAPAAVAEMPVTPTEPMAPMPEPKQPDMGKESSAPINASTPSPIPQIATAPVVTEAQKTERAMDQVSPAPSVTAPVAAPIAMEQPSATVAVDDQRLKSIEDRIEKLTTLVQQNQAATTQVQSVVDQLSDLSARLKVIEAKPVQAPLSTKASEAASAVPPPVSAETPSVDTPAPAAQVVTPTAHKAPRVKWTLRAVSNQTAYLSQKADGSITAVKVGDELSGLGTIRSIEQQGTHWVVQGTKGRISQ